MSKLKSISFLGQMLLVIILFGSCTSSKYFSHYIYLSDSTKVSHLTLIPQEEYKLQKGDRIKINVTALNPMAAQQFNMLATEQTPGLAISEIGIINPDATGYLIDNSGGIVFPQLGHVYFEGITTDSAGKLLEKRLSQYLTDPAVSVSFVNYIVNVLGEVGHVGPINLPYGKNSIIDLIGRVGDLTPYAERENILVVRQKNGKREFGRLDISSKDVFNSPYYYLQPGDLVYVEANPTKLLSLDTYQAREFTLIGLGFSVLSTTLVLINFFHLAK